MITVGIFVFPGVEELDFAGPWEVLRSWERVWPDDGQHVVLLGRDEGMISTVMGMRMLPEFGWESAPPLDVLVYPGGQGTVRLMDDAPHLEWLRGQASRDQLTTSVCTGALVLASAGLLRDRPATTHWASLETLAAIDPTIDVRPDERWVDDGDVVTASGVSAGIDMALHLVARLVSEDRAREVRRYIQYDPQPPV